MLAFVAGCDRDMIGLTPEPNENYPGVVDLGEITPVLESSFLADPSANSFYHILGPAGIGARGGATATFKGTGGKVCIITDPESVYWTQAVAVEGAREDFIFGDNLADDGDVDLEAGLSAFYNGSPGIEMGDFEAVYEDSLGNEAYIEFNECTILDWYGNVGGHDGRGAIEYCTIDTSTHPGKDYTVVLNAFSIPINDDLLSYAFAVIELEAADGEGLDDVTCQSHLTLNECTLRNEVGTDEYYDLEDAYCNEDQLAYCACHPSQCGEIDCVAYPEHCLSEEEQADPDICP
jgi:hypothetical protein